MRVWGWVFSAIVSGPFVAAQGDGARGLVPGVVHTADGQPATATVYLRVLLRPGRPIVLVAKHGEETRFVRLELEPHLVGLRRAAAQIDLLAPWEVTGSMRREDRLRNFGTVESGASGLTLTFPEREGP